MTADIFMTSGAKRLNVITKKLSECLSRQFGFFLHWNSKKLCIDSNHTISDKIVVTLATTI